MSNQKPTNRRVETDAESVASEVVPLRGKSGGISAWEVKRKRVSSPKSAAEIKLEQEDVRSTLWEMLPVLPKKVALMAAGLEQKRALQPLTSFTPVERMQIAMAVDVFNSQLNVAMQCMKKHTFH